MNTPEKWIDPEALPPAVAEALRRVVRRTRRIVALRGVCAAVGVALAAFFLVMALDARLVFMAAWPRWVLSSLAWGATAAAALWFLVRPLRRGLTLSGMARIIEQKHPELQERLSSIVELTTTGDSGETRGSEALIQALAEQAVQDVDSVRPSDAASFRQIRPWLAAAVSLLVLLVLLLAFRPRETAVLLGRAAFPMANLSNLMALDMEIEPGDARVGEGRPLALSVKARVRRGQQAVLYVTPAATRRETAVPMDRGEEAPDGRVPWVARFEAVKGDFRYRIRVDRAVSRFYGIQSVPPPVIRGVTLRYQFPPYSGLADAEAEDQGGAIHALDHTRLTLLARVNKPILKPELLIQGATPLLLTGRVVKATSGEVVLGFDLTLTPGLNGLAVLTLTDEYGFVNPPWERTVQAVADQKPVLKVLFPDKPSLRLSRLDRIPLVAAAADDLGLARTEWRMEPAPQPAVVFPAVPPAVSNRPPVAFESSTNLHLADPAFLGAGQVMLTFRVSDNRSADCGGPQWVSSPAISLVFDEAASSVDEQAFEAQEQFIKAQLDLAQRELTQGRDQLKPLGPQVAKPETEKQALQTLEEANRHVNEAARKLGLLAEGAKNGYLDKVAREAEGIAEQTLAEADRVLDQVPNQADSGAKSSGVTQALEQVQAAIDQVSALNSNFLAAAAAVKQALVLKDLASRGALLAAENPTNAAAMAEVMRERKRAADRLAEVMKTLPEGHLANALEQRLDDLAGKTEAIQKEQEALAKAVGAGEKPDAEEDKAIQAIGAEQEKLAREAQNREAARPLASEMQETANQLRRDELEAAGRRQEQVADALREKARELRNAAPPVEDGAAARLARTAADEALRDAERADRAADALDRMEDRLVQEALKPKAEGHAPEAARAEAIRKLADEAGVRRAEAEKLADAAAAKADTASRQADAVAQADEPAEREKTLAQAAAAAREADALADQAEKLADQVREKALGFEAAPDRAKRAEARAAEAAREAGRDAEAARDLRALAPDEKLAKTLKQEADKAAQAAEHAGTAAQEAKAQADKVAAAPKPEEGAEALARAEQAAAAAEKEAAAADQALDKARELLLADPAVEARLEEPVREAQAAAKEAGEAAKQAREAVQRAQQAAKQVPEKAPEAEEVKTWTAAAEHFGKAAETEAQKAREAAKRADADEAAAEQAAEQAVEAARKAGLAAEAAEDFGNKAETAAAERKPDPEKAARMAEQAKDAAQEAAQAAREAGEIARAEAGEPVEPVLKALEEEANKAAERAGQAAAKAAELAQEAARNETPAAARDAEKKAEQAAAVAKGEAETAKALVEAARGMARAEEPGERAQTAAREAEDAAREAARDELRARQAAQQAVQVQQAAQQAAQQAQAVAQQAQQAAQQAAQTPGQTEKVKAIEAERAKALAEEAARAKQEAEEAAREQAKAAEAAQATAQAAQQAKQAAQQAKQASDEAQRAGTPAAAGEKAAQAEKAAVEAVKQALAADQKAGQAEQAVPVSPKVRQEQATLQAAQAAEEAALQAQEARQAAEQARQVAEQAKGQATGSERAEPMARKAAQAAVAAGEAAKQAEAQAKEAAQNRDAARQAATPFAAEARAHDAEAQADEAGRLADEARREAAQARAALQGGNAAAVEDLAQRQRDLAAKTRDTVDQMEKPDPERWRQASARQERKTDELAGLKTDMTVARMMAEAVKKPEVAANLDRALQQAAQAEQAMKAADSAFDRAAAAAAKAESTPANAADPASDAKAAAARQASEQASDQARGQAERTQAEVGKALAAVGQEARTAVETVAKIPAAASADTPQEKAMETMAGKIPEAMRALQQAAAGPKAEQAAEAALEPLAKAAEAAEDRASALGGQPIANYPRLTMPQGSGNAAETEFEAGVRLHNWFKLSGDISGTVMENAEDGEPEDYRGLIRRYFEEVSRRSHEE